MDKVKVDLTQKDKIIIHTPDYQALEAKVKELEEDTFISKMMAREKARDKELARLRGAVLVFIREYTADEYMGIDIHELACSYNKTEVADVTDEDYLNAFVEIMQKTNQALTEGKEDKDE